MKHILLLSLLVVAACSSVNYKESTNENLVCMTEASSLFLRGADDSLMVLMHESRLAQDAAQACYDSDTEDCDDLFDAQETAKDALCAKVEELK